jgi:hypothetical protein
MRPLGHEVCAHGRQLPSTPWRFSCVQPVSWRLAFCSSLHPPAARIPNSLHPGRNPWRGDRAGPARVPPIGARRRPWAFLPATSLRSDNAESGSRARLPDGRLGPEAVRASNAPPRRAAGFSTARRRIAEWSMSGQSVRSGRAGSSAPGSTTSSGEPTSATAEYQPTRKGWEPMAPTPFR